jgi:hypothetical protein
MSSSEVPEWDLSWVDRITAAKNRVVYNVAHSRRVLARILDLLYD